MDISDRSSKITVNHNEYELILTTKATKEIAARYGGLEKLGDTLMQSENFEMAINEIIWLIVMLANQGIMIHNLKNPKNKREPLTEELLELLTSPSDLVEYKDAILDAMNKGTKRHIESAENREKKLEVGKRAPFE